MKLERDQLDEQSLIRLGQQAAGLLAQRRFGEMAQTFGYALAWGRDPASALEADLETCLAEAAGRDSSKEEIRVKYFALSKDWNVLAVIECFCSVSERPVLLELVVSSAADGVHVMVEDVSCAT